MALSDIRRQFAELSGRHDLVVDFAGGDYDNNSNNIGADFFINAGQRMLDRKLFGKKQYAWYKKDISSGDYKLTFRYCLAISEVWLVGSDNDKARLIKKPLEWMRKMYGADIGTASTGCPKYYSPIIINLSPDQIDLTSSNYTDEFSYDSDELMFSDEGDHFLYNGILLGPISDNSYTVSILGKFMSPPLSSNSTKTFWTEVHPDILLLASLWALERFYRNREGMADYMTAILDALNDIDINEVVEQVQGINQIGG